MQSSTNYDKKKTQNNIVSSAIEKKKKLFSQTKNYFCYFNITVNMSHIVVFLVLGVLNTKYLAFRTPDASTLILGWLGFFIFYFKVLFLLSFWVE